MRQCSIVHILHKETCKRKDANIEKRKNVEIPLLYLNSVVFSENYFLNSTFLFDSCYARSKFQSAVVIAHGVVGEPGVVERAW